MTDLAAPGRWARMTVHALRTATTVGALTCLVGLGAVQVGSDPRPPAGADRLGMSAGPLDAMMEQHRCSLTGFDRDVIPSQALVRTPAGHVELVSFDRGWAVFSGEIAGELVAVCLGPQRTTAPVVASR